MIKRIVCLANSRKLNGRCIAGKELSSGRWIRPIGHTLSGELTQADISYSNGGIPELLDLIDLPLDKPIPQPHQPENIHIQSALFRQVGKFPAGKLCTLLDYPPSLWDLGAAQDRVPASVFNHSPNTSSLYLIQPSSATVCVEKNLVGRKRVRLRFEYRGRSYDWGVTDPEIEGEYLRKENGSEGILTHQDTYLCLSLGEPFNGYCYKLVAAIIKAAGGPDGPQAAVLQLLKHSAAPLKAKQIVKLLDGAMDKATINRHLYALQNKGLACKDIFFRWRAAYRTPSQGTR